MMMKTNLISIFVFVLGCFGSMSLCSQTNIDTDIKKMIYKASTSNSVLLWEKAISMLETAQKECPSNEVILHLGYAHYGLAGTCIGKKEETKGTAAIEKGKTYAEKLLKQADYEDDANALLGGLTGMSIAFSPISGMFLGSKSDNYLTKALKLNAENAFALLQQGSSLYNTPRMFGGDVNAAVSTFEKAIAIFEKQNDEYDWIKLETMVWLGQALQNLERTDEAVAVYNKILEKEPNYDWVTNALLPKALNSK